MCKESPARSQKKKSVMLLERLFGAGAAKSLAAFHSKSSAEKALAASKARVRILESKLLVAKRTSLAVSRVRRKQCALAEQDSIALTGTLNRISADRDSLLSANTELLAKTENLELGLSKQKTIVHRATETNELVAECAAALYEADRAAFKRIFKSPHSSASQILTDSIMKVTSPRPLPGGKSKSGRTSPSTW